MNLYTKLGSIPTPLPDGVTEAEHLNDGWVRVVQPRPTAPEGKELAWLNWEWIIRDPKPVDIDGHQANWDHANRSWVQCPVHGLVIEDEVEIVQSEEITISSPSAMPSAGPV